ncbi:DUF3817 domain-containing protein [Corynebacterium bovis]|uniref:DUF3817 domain-containing protein n=1 Tax=Corynebacterium bovis TaxID=36808 RepID=UPI0031393B54
MSSTSSAVPRGPRPAADRPAGGRPTPSSRVSPRSLYRVVAVVEAVTWALLIIGMVLKYTGVTEAGVRAAGPVHGFVFLCFLAATALVAANGRWGAGRIVLGVVSAVVPFATVPFERSVAARGGLSGGWRFRDDDEQPRSAGQHLMAWIVRSPAQAAAVVVVVIVVVFVALLVVGPPFGG